MADNINKLVGEHHEHSDPIIETAPPMGEDCILNHFGRKALEEYGVSEDMAPLFTTSDSLQALNSKVPPETAHKFKNNFQTSALMLLGAKNAELALSFDNEMLAEALVKALDLSLDPKIALQVTKDSASAFKALSLNSLMTQALKLEVPLKEAFKFKIQYQIQAWQKIKTQVNTEEEKSVGIAEAILINEHTKLEALNADVPANLAHKFIHPTQVDAWKDIESNDKLSLAPREAAEAALKIDTKTKLAALQASVDPETASDFVNQHQVDAWSKNISSLQGYTAKDALKIDTEIKLKALLAGAAPEDAASFTKDIQVKAWELISAELTNKKQSVEFALSTTDDIQLEALKAKIPPSDALEVVNKVQIAIWKKMTEGKENVKTRDVLKVVREAAQFKTIHQGNVLLAGADLATAQVAMLRTHEVAHIKHGISSPNLLKKFDAQHKLDLLEAGLDKEIASETNWPQAQYLLVKADYKKYFGGISRNLKDEAKSIQEKPTKLWDYLTLKTAGVTATAIFSIITAFAIIRKAAMFCCGKSTAATTTGRGAGGGGLEDL